MSECGRQVKTTTTERKDVGLAGFLLLASCFCSQRVGADWPINELRQKKNVSEKEASAERSYLSFVCVCVCVALVQQVHTKNREAKKTKPSLTATFALVLPTATYVWAPAHKCLLTQNTAQQDIVRCISRSSWCNRFFCNEKKNELEKERESNIELWQTFYIPSLLFVRLINNNNNNQ